jgi:hypothetical protein
MCLSFVPKKCLTPFSLKVEIQRRGCRVKNSKWWEIISNAEFLMLLGKTDIAILKVNEFLEFEEITSTFDMTTTLRQLKLYIHFTQDRNAIKFYEYLKTSWEILSPTSL